MTLIRTVQNLSIRENISLKQPDVIALSRNQARMHIQHVSPSMPVKHVSRTEIMIGERTTPLVARVNRRAKRLILSVDQIAGEIIVTAPTKRALPEAIAFAKERSDWIATQLNDQMKAAPFADGMTFPYRGVDHSIVLDGARRTPVRVEDGHERIVHVGGEQAHVNRRITDWLKREARNSLADRADHYCRLLNKSRGPIRIRDMRSRWGSCSSDGALSFSWRLILAPAQILDYVAAHECVHLVHMNHSRQFWRTLEALDVDARAASTWFNKNGQKLFTYGAPARAYNEPPG